MKIAFRIFFLCLVCLTLPLWFGCGSSTGTVAVKSVPEDFLLEQLKKEHSFETNDKQITIVVRGVDEQRQLIEPKITLKKEDTTIEAQRAQIVSDIDANILTITFEDVRVISGDTTFSDCNQAITISMSEIVPR